LNKDSIVWNAINYACFIWHQGPYAAINENRLGAEAIVTIPSSRNNNNNNTNGVTAVGGDEEQGFSTSSVATTALGAMAATVSLPGRYLGFGASSAEVLSPVTNNNNSNTTKNDANETTNISQQQQQQYPASSNSSHLHSSPNFVPPPIITTTIRIPWTEINSALGQIVLLLSHLEQTPHAGISFPHHVLIPQGSTSKIGLRQPNAITGWGSSGGGGRKNATTKEIPIVAMYHLYSDDSFALFGKRNFNLALRALTECLAIAANAIHARDRTIVMPFPIQVEHDNPSAPCLIGGLNVQYGGTSTTTTATTALTVDPTNNSTITGGGTNQNDGMIAWTRVMKYLLTNVKCCVAYAAKHVDQ